MNDPSVTPIDIEEQRLWLQDFKESRAASWSDLAKRTGIASGTLSQFGSKNGYGGNEAGVAEKIYRYRQMLAAQAAIATEVPETPGYFETETSKQLLAMLAYAQRGKIVVAAMGAGLGKTMTAQHYAACYSNVFVATMSPSKSGVNNMQIEVLRRLGERNPVGTPQRLSDEICDRVRNLDKPLLIIDEAQHLSEKSIEEIRSWHDAVGVGVALFGNVGVMQRLEGGSRSAAYAQLYSRMGLRVVRNLPLSGDVDALAHAWQVFDDVMIAYLRKVAMTPGGLRGATMALEVASMIATSERKPLGLDHIQDAWAQLSSRPVAA